MTCNTSQNLKEEISQLKEKQTETKTDTDSWTQDNKVNKSNYLNVLDVKKYSNARTTQRFTYKKCYEYKMIWTLTDGWMQLHVANVIT